MHRRPSCGGPGRRSLPEADEGGFALLELIVVIAIISILATILLASLQLARDKSRRAICMSNLRQIGAALYLYALDGGGGRFLPPMEDDLRPLYPQYLSSLRTFVCPGRGRKKLTSVDQLVTIPVGEVGIGMDYEYSGAHPLYPLTIDMIADSMMLAQDSDNRGSGGFIDDADNHGDAGANMLYGDGSVHWVKAENWPPGD